MAKKKYLRKNEFRKYKNPNYLTKSGSAHPAYISVHYGHKYKFNVITHSETFFDKPTEKMKKNPEINSKYKDKESRVSIPKWDYDYHFSERLSKYSWRLSKDDKKLIKNINKKQK